jgi:hypothetical protein
MPRRAGVLAYCLIVCEDTMGFRIRVGAVRAVVGTVLRCQLASDKDECLSYTVN